MYCPAEGYSCISPLLWSIKQSDEWCRKLQVGRWFFSFIFINAFGGHQYMSYFGATGTPLLNFWWRLLWVSWCFMARMDSFRSILMVDHQFSWSDMYRFAYVKFMLNGILTSAVAIWLSNLILQFASYICYFVVFVNLWWTQVLMGKGVTKAPIF